MKWRVISMARRAAFIALAGLLFASVSCKKKEKPPENFLTKSLHNPVFQRYFPRSQRMILRLSLAHYKDRYDAYPLLYRFYEARHFEPYFVPRYLSSHQLDTLLNYLKDATYHGLDPAFYHTEHYENTLRTLRSPHTDNLILGYLTISDLELSTLNSLFDYAKDLQYGRIDANTLYKNNFNYKYKRPDSVFFTTVGRVEQLTDYLKSVQPAGVPYQKLKDTLKTVMGNGVNTASKPLINTLKINLERLRWKNSDSSTSYIFVNVPAYMLYIVNKDKVLRTMRVCVGQRRKPDYEDKLKKYRTTHNIDDKPVNRQTPLISSTIRSIQLNPKWSIPSSIFQNEIYFNLKKNPNYLAENNMKLYRGNKEVGRIDTINWSKIKRDHIPFTIKQDAGEYNALGKIKFLFPNPYSVYLHDTPKKGPFNKTMRDVSHGCVRVQQPLALARYLSEGNGKGTINYIRVNIGMKPEDTTPKWMKLYDKKQKALSDGKDLVPTSIVLKIKMPIFINYFTCYTDSASHIRFYDDIYHMDDKIKFYLNGGR